MSAIAPVSSAEAAAYTSRIQNVSFGSSVPKLANLPEAEQAREVGRQFEAILVRQMLDESIGKSLMGGDGAQSNVYGYMLTDLFAEKLTQGSGLGLGQMLTRQLMSRKATTAEITPEKHP